MICSLCCFILFVMTFGLAALTRCCMFGQTHWTPWQKNDLLDPFGHHFMPSDITTVTMISQCSAIERAIFAGAGDIWKMDG